MTGDPFASPEAGAATAAAWADEHPEAAAALAERPPAAFLSAPRPRASAPTLRLVRDASATKPTEPTPYEIAAVKGELRRVAELEQAGWTKPWDSTTFEAACQLIELANSAWASITLEGAHERFLRYCPPAEPGYDPEAKWRSALNTVGDKARPAPEPTSSAADPFGGWETNIVAPSSVETAGEVVVRVEGAMTDANVTDAFVRQVRDRVRYCPGIGWLDWDGRRFVEVDESVIIHKSKLFAQALTVQAAKANDMELVKVATARMKAPNIRAVVGLAKGNPDLRVDVAQLDADPGLLNCANGTLDLRTRTLRPHSPDDLLTKVTVGAYDPTADARTWAGFLESVIPDAEERGYLRRVFGQAAYGRVREHLFAVFTGEGANGKGTCYGAVTAAFGDYAAIINPDMLMLRERGGVGGPEMMQLRGARLVIGSETERDRQLDEAMMKRLTGGDELTARNLYCPPVSWQPSHQLVYVTNHLPRVKGNDPAVWRRIRVVPFDVVVPPERRDPALPERLASHRDAILTWAVHGWFDYMDRGGMAEPATVRLATDAYAVRSDAVRRYVDETCETGPLLHEAAGALYAAWQRWSVADGAEPMTEKAFAGELERLGFSATRTRTGMRRQGLRLPDHSPSG